MRLLLVEDNDRLAAAVAEMLKRAGFEADRFADIASARAALDAHEYGVLVVDRGLPDGDGLALVRGLRARRVSTPCLVLTAQNAIHDRVDGLDSGADDYLPKPFAMEELVARVRALARRRAVHAARRFEIANLALDLDTCRAEVDGAAVELTPRDFALLAALAGAHGGFMLREKLFAAAYGPFSESNGGAMDVAIHRVRRKLEHAGSAATIVNVRGLGYALRDHARG